MKPLSPAVLTKIWSLGLLLILDAPFCPHLKWIWVSGDCFYSEPCDFCFSSCCSFWKRFQSSCRSVASNTLRIHLHFWWCSCGFQQLHGCFYCLNFWYRDRAAYNFLFFGENFWQCSLEVTSSYLQVSSNDCNKGQILFSSQHLLRDSSVSFMCWFLKPTGKLHLAEYVWRCWLELRALRDS